MSTITADYKGLHIELRNGFDNEFLVVDGEIKATLSGMFGPRDESRFGFWSRKATLKAVVNGVFIVGSVTNGWLSVLLEIFCDNTLVQRRRVWFWC